jgi:uncharacterized protein (DUF433 family)
LLKGELFLSRLVLDDKRYEARPLLNQEQAARIKADGSRAMAGAERIEVNPKVMLGKPVIRGTRVPVELILRKLAEGATESDLLDGYPGLTVEDIKATIAYGADSVAHEESW